MTLSLTVLSCSDLPAWKQLISPTLSTDERIHLITSIFSDRNEAEVVGYLSGDDTQAFVDAVYEVIIHPLLPPRSLLLKPSCSVN